jgi:hypothetical protein
MLEAGMRSGLFVGVALALMVTAAPAQELTPFQSQALAGIKKSLVEYTQKLHANCDATAKEVCETGRVDVLDEVLKGWENTPDYGRYAVGVMEWHTKLSEAITDLADDYAAQHGDHLDAGFEGEVRRRILANPAFAPPQEYTCRHIFGTPHLNGSKGPCK